MVLRRLLLYYVLPAGCKTASALLMKQHCGAVEPADPTDILGVRHGWVGTSLAQPLHRIAW